MTAKKSTPEFRAIVEHKLCAYRSQVATWRPKRCRLVQYTGADRPNCRDVDIGQIEDEIAFNLEEGMYVDWHRTEEDVYLFIFARKSLDARSLHGKKYLQKSR